MYNIILNTYKIIIIIVRLSTGYFKTFSTFV